MKSFDNKHTVIYCGIVFEATFDYDAAEPQTFDEPGSPASVTLTELTLPESQIDLMPILCENHVLEIEDTLLLNVES